MREHKEQQLKIENGKVVTKTTRESIVVSHWFRGEYHIKEGTIYLEESPDYSEKNLYNPAGEQNLHVDLVNVDVNSPEDVLAFVNRYGLLEDHGDTVPINVGAFMPEGIYPAPRSESVEFFEAQVVSIRYLVELCSLVKSEKPDPKRLREVIAFLERGDGVMFGGYGALDKLSYEAKERITEAEDGNMIGAAMTYITVLLLRLLRSAPVSLKPNFKKRTFSECFRTEGLLPNIYLQIYWQVVGDKKFLLCPGCDDYFVPKTEHETRFCGKTCRKRINTREYRKEKPAKGGENIGTRINNQKTKR